MLNNNKVLAIIPARGDSTNIPRRNMRLLGEKPIISYVIETAKASKYVDDVVVSTEDISLLRLAELYGAIGIRCPDELSTENSKIAEIVHDTMMKQESRVFDEYDIVVTILPNAPLLRTKTLDKMLERFDNKDIETVIAVVGDRKFYWIFDDETKGYYQLYPQRENIDFLPKTFTETRNLSASRRNVITPESRLGKNIDLFEVSAEEGFSIINYKDIGIVNNYLNRKKFAFVLGMDEGSALDNIDRCLSLSSKIFFHEVMFFIGTHNESKLKMVDKYKYPYTQFNGTTDLLNKIKEFNPNLIFNDIGDTSVEYMTNLKNADALIINFGDNGPGYELADIVFDDLYEHNLGQNNVFVGKEYFLLKDKFYFQKKKILDEKVNNVLLFFEGKDLNNLTERILNVLIKSGYSKHIYVVLGMDYPNKNDLMDKYQIYPNVVIYENAINVEELLFKSDIVISSAGRFSYEVCSIGVPSIVLCQNERELSYSFVNKSNGFFNLGLSADVSDEKLIETFNLLVNDFEIRLKMQENMFNVDLKYGFENIWYEIKKAYRVHSLNIK